MARITGLPWGGDAGALGAVLMLSGWGRLESGQAGKKRWHFGKTARKLSRVTCIDAHGKFANYSKSRF
jgi:hypothetical protein